MKHWTQDALMDAALGEIAPAREAELRAHIAECAACRGEFEAAKAACAAVNAGLEPLISAAPSVQFETRLRARLAAEPEPSRARSEWTSWAPVAVGALAVAAALLIALRVHSPGHVAPNAIPPLAGQLQPSPASPLALTAPMRSTPQPPSRRERPDRATRSASARPAEPEVIVEPGQFAAILQYSKALASGRIKGDRVIAARLAMEQPLDIKFLEIEPTEIAPLEKTVADDVTPSPGDSNRR